MSDVSRAHAPDPNPTMFGWGVFLLIVGVIGLLYGYPNEVWGSGGAILIGLAAIFIFVSNYLQTKDVRWGWPLFIALALGCLAGVGGAMGLIFNELLPALNDFFSWIFGFS